MALALIFSLSACAGTETGGNSQNSDSKLSGKTYALESAMVDGKDATEEVMAMFKEQTITFKDHGACTQSMIWSEEFEAQMGDPVKQTGTYEETENSVTITFREAGEEDTAMTFTIEGDTITLDEEGSITVYRVQF